MKTLISKEKIHIFLHGYFHFQNGNLHMGSEKMKNKRKMFGCKKELLRNWLSNIF